MKYQSVDFTVMSEVEEICPYEHVKKDRTKTVCCVIYETSGSRETKETE